MRPIDADAIEYGDVTFEALDGFAIFQGAMTTHEEIDKIPTLDLESLRPKTRFIEEGTHWFYCDNCEATFWESNSSRKSWKYCPKCGAKVENEP